MGMLKKRVLFLCTANSARSQMAEGLARDLGAASFEVWSAGSEPSFVHPMAIRVMAEIGLDIGGHRSKALSELPGESFDEVVTVCDRAAKTCPVFPGSTLRTHWSVPDPAAVDGTEEQILEAFRTVRDDLRRRLLRWLAEHRAQSEAPSS